MDPDFNRGSFFALDIDRLIALTFESLDIL
jgi:hypothetical protein